MKIRSLTRTVASLCARSMASGGLLAHPIMIYPNGGEILRAGTTIKIEWAVAISHPSTGWDLFYTLDDVNHVLIEKGMPVTQLKRDWIVPRRTSNKLRFRIVQVSTGFSYDDYGDNTSQIENSLEGDVSTISLSTGGTQVLSLITDQKNAMRQYLVAGSLTGTKPARRFGFVRVPLLFDVYTDLTIEKANTSVLSNSCAKLDAMGKGRCTFNVPKGISSALIGMKVHHAFVTYTAAGMQMASNAVTVTLVR